MKAQNTTDRSSKHHFNFEEKSSMVKYREGEREISLHCRKDVQEKKRNTV
jgi:hypothetical protein